MNRFTAAAAALLAAASATSMADARPLTAEDLAGLNRLGGVAVSPDESTLVFSMRETDFAENKGRTDLFRLDLSTPGSAPERWHAHPESDGDPVFSADGEHVYWLSGRSDDAQVWRAPLAGGDPEPVTTVDGGISGFHMTPDGERVIFWKEEVPDGAETGTGVVYDGLYVRQWDSWTENGRSKLYSLRVDAGEPVELTAALGANVPTRPFGDGGDITISPDGKTVYFVSRDGGSDDAWTTDTDIYAMPVDGLGEPMNLTEGRDGYDRSPAVSPDGRTLAWLAMDEPGAEAKQSKIYLRDLASGEVQQLVPAWGMSADSISWNADGRSLTVGAHDGWNGRLYTVGLDGSIAQLDLPDGSVDLVQRGAGGLIFKRSSLTEPGDIYRWADGTIQTLTAINGDKLADIDFGEVERFSFPGAMGDTVYGYAVKPPMLGEGEAAKTVLWSHGGPQGQWSNGWSSRWNPQVWAAAGFGIVAIDFHGSSGYGQDFTDSINNDWGGKPLEDLQKGLAYARETYDWLDDEEACAAGGSYGGYMMNWIEGKWPGEFACLVNHAGLFDMRSMYYSTEELFFPEFDFGGPYYAREEAYEKWNPARFVNNWRTPMLVIHGLKDYRVPYSQGLMTFTALQRKEIDSRLLVFEDENHWILKPANSIQWHAEVFRWMDEHLAD